MAVKKREQTLCLFPFFGLLSVRRLVTNGNTATPGGYYDTPRGSLVIGQRSVFARRGLEKMALFQL